MFFIRYIHRPINPDDPPIVEQPKPLYPYRTIGCVFNHQKFYGNCQPSDAVEVCVFDLHDESKWKPMSAEAIKSSFFFFCLSSSVKSVLHYFIPCRNLCKFSEIPSHLRFFSEEHMQSLCAVRLQESLNSFPFCSTSSVSQAYRMVLEPNFYTKRKQYAQDFNGKNFLVMDDSADPYHYTSQCYLKQYFYRHNFCDIQLQVTLVEVQWDHIFKCKTFGFEKRAD